MGTEDCPKLIFISKSFISSKKDNLVALIREDIDVFTWKYEDMPSLDPKVMVRQLNIKPKAKPIKQQ